MDAHLDRKQDQLKRWDGFETEELIYLVDVLGEQEFGDGCGDALYDELNRSLKIRADKEHDGKAIEKVYG